MDGTPFTQNQVAAGRHVPLQVQGHPAGDLLVPPAPPLVDEPGVQGAVRDDHRHRSQRGRAPATAATLPSAAETQADRAQRHDGVQGARDATTRRPTVRRCRGSAAAALPGQSAPTPKTLCETPTAIDEDGNRPEPATRRATSRPSSATPAARSKPHNEGQTVLTNGKNVGGRAGYAGSSRAPWRRGARRSTSSPARACGCSSSTRRRSASSACA